MADLYREWYDAHRKVFHALMEVCEPVFDGSLEEGRNAYSNVMPTKTNILMFGSGGGNRMEHWQRVDKVANFSARTDAIVIARFRYERNADGSSEGEKRAMMIQSAILHNMPFLREGACDAFYPFDHGQVTPVWMQLHNEKEETMHFEFAQSFEMVYSDT